MHLRIVALGQRMPAWVDAGFEDYRRRVARDHSLELVLLKPEPRDRGKTVAAILGAEATRIRAACARHAVVALDERGEPWTTRTLADRLAAWRDRPADVAFVIGSADGLDPAVKASAEAVVALSAMTLPHGLARVLAAEQIYRALSMLAGHPYHRE
jgi:23S rRNA (pseudouridine1915-N3)-methyltransferase